MATDDKTASLGSLPGRVLSTPGGGYAAAPSSRPAVNETDSAQAVKATTASIAAGLTHPTRDDALIEGCRGLGNLIKLRVHPGTPLRDVPHPADAETLLVPIATFTATALREEPAAADLVSIEADDLVRRCMQLQRARNLRDTFAPVVETLDLIVRNLEDGIDTDLRTTHRLLASLIDNNPRFAERFGRLKSWTIRNGQRSVESRRRNARRDEGRLEPTPAATTTTPATPTTATPAPTPAPAAPLPQATTRPAPAPAGRNRRRPRRG